MSKGMNYGKAAAAAKQNTAATDKEAAALLRTLNLTLKSVKGKMLVVEYEQPKHDPLSLNDQ